MTLAVATLACRNASPGASSDTADRVVEPRRVDLPIGGARPVRAFRAANGTKPAPVVLVLHGYGADGSSFLEWSGLERIPEVHLVAPDGTLDSRGHRFWNATATCCDFEGTGVDDVKYLSSLIDDVAARHPVDRTRVYAVGLSNGGAMALRLACEDRVAAVVSFAAPWNEHACAPKSPVAVRHLHGTADTVVPYGGGPVSKGIHPNAHGTLLSATALIDGFARRASCTGPLVEQATIDLDRAVAGEETTIARYSDCSAPVELWTLRGSSHVPPPLRDAFADETWKFLAARHR